MVRHRRRPGWPRRPADAPSRGALRRSAAACRDRAGADLEADRPLRGRADGQPRLGDRRGDPRADPFVGPRRRPDRGDGDPRGARSRDCRPRALPRGRQDRPRDHGGDAARRHGRDGGDQPAVTVFAARALWARKLRTALTAVAIVLGVAMVSGTYVLTDSIDQAFDRIFTDVRQGSNAVVTGKSAFDLSAEGGFTAPPFDEVVLGGAPNLGFSIDPENTRFNPLTLVQGEWPGASEVAIDEATADRENFRIGERNGVQAAGPVVRLRLSGIVKFGSVSTIGGATLAGFDLETAQRLFDKEGKLDEIAVASPRNVSDDELVAEIERVLPSTARVRTAEEQAASDAEGTDEFITFLQGFLLAFGGIALFVGAFVIANSLSITIAQRTREFATLRTLGGSRRQVLRSIVLEALIVGVVASVIGLFLGLALARLLFWLFDLAGFTLPNTGLLFLPRTIFVALAVGIVVTLVASLRPAFRATRVPPIAAVREGASLPESRLARFRTPGAVLLAALGFAAIL